MALAQVSPAHALPDPQSRSAHPNGTADNRLGVAELILPPRTPGPPPHWHEMHDETFFITQGTIRFHVPDTVIFPHPLSHQSSKLTQS